MTNSADNAAAAVQQIREALEQLQWGRSALDPDGDAINPTVYNLCPICDQSEVRTHAPDCPVPAAFEQLATLEAALAARDRRIAELRAELDSIAAAMYGSEKEPRFTYAVRFLVDDIQSMRARLAGIEQANHVAHDLLERLAKTEMALGNANAERDNALAARDRRIAELEAALKRVRDLICGTASVILMPGTVTLDGHCVSAGVITNAQKAMDAIQAALKGAGDVG